MSNADLADQGVSPASAEQPNPETLLLQVDENTIEHTLESHMITENEPMPAEILPTVEEEWLTVTIHILADLDCEKYLTKGFASTNCSIYPK